MSGLQALVLMSSSVYNITEPTYYKEVEESSEARLWESTVLS